MLKYPKGFHPQMAAAYVAHTAFVLLLNIFHLDFSWTLYFIIFGQC